jgi:hypothetical protein
MQDRKAAGYAGLCGHHIILHILPLADPAYPVTLCGYAVIL